jgi:ring-1,2-phenylacetyl-CoA epoxidase subunit PaaA
VQDECGHGLYLYAAAETLGTSREELVDLMLAGQGKVFLDLQLSDADLGRHRRDRLAGRRRGDHEPDSAVPLFLRSLCARDDPRLQGESFHQRQGFEIMVTLSKGSEEQKAMAQSALDRWWWPVLMMFGPPDKASQHSDTRQNGRSSASPTTSCARKFVDATVPQAQFLG